ncbi:SRPBCC family protein [Prauserella cavernicola]|uniref:SRPBCC domain-containing protein n=1 Tax=Prauserella cavernicola TaxID=2800127 RepID=A0A934V7C1_9PSEU|nr:SRPBCC domain-containing protein [Prauserella cavernicola]MBK1788427.1 SRPBCC domain-containing protein [Prauserella cavernicola]
MSERRRLEKRIELDASPEEVWEAVSTTAGLSVWFVPHQADESGEVSADFGDGNTQAGKVLAWEEGRRVVYGGPDDESEQTAAVALEFLVEGRDRGGTVLRFVHSGFAGDEDWADEYGQHSRGWDLFFRNLVAYFEHFAGLPVTGAVATAFTELGGDEVSDRLHRALGVATSAAPGERVRLSPAGPAPVDGVLDVREPGVLGVRSADGLYRFLGLGGGTHRMVNVTIYRYGADVDGASLTGSWQTWLDGVMR